MKDFDGRIQLLVGDRYSQKKLFTAYSKELNIGKGITKTLNLEAFTEEYKGNMTVRILDKNNRIIWEDMIKVPFTESTDTVSIGVLSDDIESLRYFNLVRFVRNDKSNSFFNSLLVDLNDYMPEKSELLNSLDIIVINDYNTEKLNKKQISALKTWINKGGTLLVGTGPSYQKTLKGLIDIKNIKVDGLDSIETFSDLKGPSGDVFEGEAPLLITKLSMNKDDELFREGDETLIYKVKIASGNLLITTFDLGLDPFIQWNEKSDFFSNILEKYMSFQTENDMKYMGASGYYRSQNIVEYLPQDKMPSMKIILGIIVLFILIVGPINYIILKGIDKRELAWITIPSIVLLFSFAIYMWGIGTRFDNPLANNVSIMEFTAEKNIKIDRTIGIMGFTKGNIDASFDGESVYAITENNNGVNVFNFNDGDVVREYVFDKDKSIVFMNRGLWDVQTVKIDEDITIADLLSQDLYLKNNKISGQIKNLSDMNLEDIVVVFGDSFKKLGNLDSGQYHNLDFQLKTTASNYQRTGIYNMVDLIYPYSYNPLNSDKDILNDNIKREILWEHLQNSQWEKDRQYNLMMIGWNREPITKDITINGVKSDRIDRNLVIIPLDIKFNRGDIVEIPYDILSAEVIELNNLNIEWPAKRFFGKGYAIFRTKPMDNIEITELSIDITGINATNNYNIEIYNYQLNQWEAYNQSTIIIDKNNMNQYYKAEEGARIKIETVGDGVIDAPRFSVKGVSK